MQEILKNAVVLFLQKFNRYLMLILPLMILNLVTLPLAIKLILTALITLFVTIYIYLDILRPQEMYLLKSPRFVVRFMVADLGVYSIFYLLVLFSLKEIGSFHPWVAYLAIYFGTLYFLIRFSIVLPMVIEGRALTLQKIMQTTNHQYWQWMIAVTVMYFPLLVLKWYLKEGFAFELISAIQIPWLCCFNASYLLKR